LPQNNGKEISIIRLQEINRRCNRKELACMGKYSYICVTVLQSTIYTISTYLLSR
jgi:hypothetical protein